MIVYFSSVSENTLRFVEKLGTPAIRIPLNSSEAELIRVDEPYTLITPTYGAGSKGFVPKQVKKFLSVKENREFCTGVIGSGNTNFGAEYALAGPIVAAKINVPLLYIFELAGTEEDVQAVLEGIGLVEDPH